MAINNWRPVLTDHWPMAGTADNVVKKPSTPVTNTGVITQSWPMATNGTGTVTPVTSSPFSNADVYNLQSQWYANLWDNAMSQAYWNIANNLWAYSNFANTSLNNYDALLNYIKGNEQGLQSVAGKLYNNLVGDIQTQRDYINQMFGPEGTLTKEVNTYYDDLWNYLATDAGRQAAKIAAQWMHSWASLWAIRAQQNEAYNESFWRYIQAKEQQINAKQQLASNLINYMSTLRQEYWDTTNQYIIELYKRANDMYNSIAQSAANDLREYNNLRISRGWGGSSGWPYYDIWGNQIDSNGNIIKTKTELDKEIVNALPFKDTQWNYLYYVTRRNWTNDVTDKKWNNAQAQWSIPTNGTGHIIS